ncbi:YhjD/YihY/BrkB family envelope integrity protein [Streptomyces flavofungini]|uniref:YhjD/YihY/BrkB family envelope integrity protein n=1 Tax=Streptomyces flavofungini TaxID=68200 RepID=UPI0025AF7AE1|nr:YhjD/YihY/BrkB family envelope integrity protein [Streptomyces flavofungini]WJV50635.1 YhjD/YihY/BrkB family envelope integrity protein [Streptomyces flavofungini]
MVSARPARSLTPRVVHQLVHVNILDTATRLAAQVFLAALPLLIAVASLCPRPVRRELLSSLRSTFAVGGRVRAPVEELLAGTQRTAYSWGAASVLVALLSATAFTRALQRLCERSWHLPRAEARVMVWRWACWLVVWIAVLVLRGAIHTAFGAGPAFGVVLELAAVVLLWWWSQHLLLAGRVPWLPLLPGALLTGVGVIVFSGVSALWLPRALEHGVERYGTLGTVFTLLSWLIVFFVVVVLGTAVGYVLAHDASVRGRLGTPAPPSR